MSIFDNVSGLKGENISTELLSYFLQKENQFIPFQKLFYLKIFNIPVDSKTLNAEVITQSQFFNGRPDFLCLTNDSLIVFENKLGSFLSGIY